MIEAIFAGFYADIFRRLPYLKAFEAWVIPQGIMEKRKTHFKMSQEKVTRRLAKENNRADFFSYVLSQKDTNITNDFMLAQSNTLVIAGSETTSTALAGITYFLTKSPDKLARLMQEVRDAYSDPSEIGGDSTQRLPYLQAVIEEGLRVFPPAAFGLPRHSTGLVIGGHYIAAGTTVHTPAYAMSRWAPYWHLPNEFHPERWLPKDHPHYSSVFDNDQKESSKPFSLGPRACIGINLANLEMRIILAKLAWQFDWEPEYGDLDWLKENRLLFLWKKPRLHIRYKPRAVQVGSS
jgi:cytochrome P450